jgi:hypothetical protein
MINNVGGVDPTIFYVFAETKADMIAQQNDLIQSVIDGSGGFFVSAQINFAGKQYVPLDKSIIVKLLQLTGLNINVFPTQFDQSGFLPNETFWNKPKTWPTSDGARGSDEEEPSTITGIWIIVRNGLYFAGFEAGSGDPIFVKFLFGTVSAHLYITQKQADEDSARIRRFYQRPDIPVEVVEI